MTHAPHMKSASIAFAACWLLSACAAQPKVEYVPVAIECPAMPAPPAELMTDLPTLDLVPQELLPPKE